MSKLCIKTWIVAFSIILALSAIVLNCTKQDSASNELTIGCISILSGEVATYGKETRQGIDLAIEETNNSGILGDKKIKVIYEDSQIDAKIGTQAINKLINIDKVPLIIGAFSSRVTLAISPIAERNQTVLISASATADAVKDAGDYIFRIVPPNKAQGTTAAKFALDKLDKKTAAVFHVNDEYGVSLAAEFKKAYEEFGGKILFYEGFNPGQKDFRSSIQKIINAKPAFVYFPGQAAETGLILKQSKELGLDVPFIGGDGSYSPDLITIAGNTAENTYYTLMAMGFGVSDSLISNFESNYEAKYNEKPTVYAAYAYEAGKIVGSVLSEAEYTGDSIKEHLYALNNFKGITGYTSFDEYGEVNKDFYMYVVKDGDFELWK